MNDWLRLGGREAGGNIRVWVVEAAGRRTTLICALAGFSPDQSFVEVAALPKVLNIERRVHRRFRVTSTAKARRAILQMRLAAG